jgi:hypothetical protein
MVANGQGGGAVVTSEAGKLEHRERWRQPQHAKPSAGELSTGATVAALRRKKALLIIVALVS